MFDLETIEKDWLNNSFKLSEEEIIEIYRSENVTLNKYNEEINDFIDRVNGKKTNDKIKTNFFTDDEMDEIHETIEYNSSEEDFVLFTEDEIKETQKELNAYEENNNFSEEKFDKMDDELLQLSHLLEIENIDDMQQREAELCEKYVFPEKRRLSKESQNKIIEGSLYLVFDSTKEWYKFFDGLISMEKIYYICLESLVNSVKYMLHCEKPVFELYVLKSIERNIIKYVAKWNKMTYREVYQIVNSYYYNFNKKDERNNLLCNFEISEEVIKPSSIFYQLRNESYDVDYLKNISSSEFMEDYNKFLETLDETERMIMNLSFDSLGNRGLTNAEISDYLGIEKNKVENTRRKIMKKLRKDSKINTYRKK